jgi:hypothetical protein
MLQGCLYGKGIYVKELDQRHVITVSKNVFKYQNWQFPYLYNLHILRAVKHAMITLKS